MPRSASSHANLNSTQLGNGLKHTHTHRWTQQLIVTLYAAFIQNCVAIKPATTVTTMRATETFAKATSLVTNNVCNAKATAKHRNTNTNNVISCWERNINDNNNNKAHNAHKTPIQFHVSHKHRQQSPFARSAQPQLTSTASNVCAPRHHHQVVYLGGLEPDLRRNIKAHPSVCTVRTRQHANSQQPATSHHERTTRWCAEQRRKAQRKAALACKNASRKGTYLYKREPTTTNASGCAPNVAWAIATPTNDNTWKINKQIFAHINAFPATLANQATKSCASYVLCCCACARLEIQWNQTTVVFQWNLQMSCVVPNVGVQRAANNNIININDTIIIIRNIIMIGT